MSENERKEHKQPTSAAQRRPTEQLLMRHSSQGQSARAATSASVHTCVQDGVGAGAGGRRFAHHKVAAVYGTSQLPTMA